MLNPFRSFHREGAIVGRILVGYSEIEFDLALCATVAAAVDHDTIIRILYRLRGEESRFQIADAIMRPQFNAAELKGGYEEMMSAIRWCKKVRNQYAHSQWWAEPGQGLFFHDLEKSAKTNSGVTTIEFRHVDVPLLASQEAFLEYADAWAVYLRDELTLRKGLSDHNGWTAPRAMPQPPLHNPPETHRLRYDHWTGLSPEAEPPDAPPEA